MEIQEFKRLLREDLSAKLFELIVIKTNKNWLVAHIEKYGIEIQWNPYWRSPEEYQVDMRWIDSSRTLSKTRENDFDIAESRAINRSGLRKQIEFMINKADAVIEEGDLKRQLYKKYMTAF